MKKLFLFEDNQRGIDVLNALSLRGSVTRAGATATYIDPNGVLQTAAANAARWDYTNGARGLLIEEGRTNFALHSQDINNAVYTKFNSNVGPVAANGLQPLIPTTTPTTPHYISQAASYTSGVTYTQTWAARAGGYNFLRLSFSAAAFPASERACCFDLSNGTIVATQTNTTPRITLVPATVPYYLCSLTATANATAAGDFAATINQSASASLQTFTADGVSNIQLGRVQLTEGFFPTSHIPTTTIAVARNSDIPLLMLSNFPGFNPVEGTFVLDVQGVDYVDGVNRRRFVEIGDGTGNERFIAGYTNLTDVSLLVTDGGATQANMTQSATPSNRNKIAFAYKQDDFAMSANGGAVVTDVGGTLPTVDSIYLGHGLGAAAGTFLNGWIYGAPYFPWRLPNAAQQALSAA